MTRAHLTAATMFGLIMAIGCGGSGPSSNSTGTTDGTTATTSTGTTATGTTATTGGDPIPGPTDTVTIEGLNVAETNPLAPILYIDPLNIEALQTVQFELVDYTTDGTRTVLPATGTWSISTAATAFGSIAESSGRFTAKSAGTDSLFEVKVRYFGVDYTTQFKVNNRQGNILSQVVDPSGNPVRGVTVQFFDNTGLTVGQVHQPVQNDFLASVPTSAVSFTVVDDDTLPSAFAKFFTYKGATYTAGDRDHPALLGSDLTIGANVFPNIILVAAGT